MRVTNLTPMHFYFWDVVNDKAYAIKSKILDDQKSAMEDTFVKIIMTHSFAKQFGGMFLNAFGSVSVQKVVSLNK
jgi:hypothetical protein